MKFPSAVLTPLLASVICLGIAHGEGRLGNPNKEYPHNETMLIAGKHASPYDPHANLNSEQDKGAAGDGGPGLKKQSMDMDVKRHRSLDEFTALDDTLPKLKAKYPDVGDLVEKFHPVFDFDGDGCLPGSAISRYGELSGGNGIGLHGKGTHCRDQHYMEKSNTYHRWAKAGDHQVHVFDLYFDKDQCDTQFCGHRHDIETVLMYFTNDKPTHVGVSAHGNYNMQKWDDIPKKKDGHPMVVYHSEGSKTHAFRFAKKSEETGEEKAENPEGEWVMPPLASWEHMVGDTASNAKLRQTLDLFEYFNAEPKVSDRSFFYTVNEKSKPNEYPKFNMKEYPGYDWVPFEVRVLTNGQCMTANTDSNVQISPCVGDSNQKWYPADGQIKNVKTQECLSHDEGGNVKLWPCWAALFQQWQRGKNNEISSFVGDGKCMDMHMGTKNLYMFGCHGGTNQQFRVVSEIQNQANHGECLDMNMKNENVYVHSCHQGNNQKWYYEGGVIKNESNGKCLSHEGDNVRVWPCWAANFQQWRYRGDYQINSIVGDGKCMEMKWENKNLYMNSCSGGGINQKFKLSSWFFN